MGYLWVRVIDGSGCNRVIFNNKKDRGEHINERFSIRNNERFITIES
jgi:hypothetical protein